MFSKLTTRQKEIFTGVCGLAMALGLMTRGDALVVRVQQNDVFDKLRSREVRKTLADQVARAYYNQESTGLRLAVPGARFFDIRFNSRGFRGPELQDEPDDKVIRIAYLGSSITLDKRSYPDENSWAALTTHKLEEAFPGCRFTYQNTGITGMSSRQMVAYYEEMLHRFRPDIAVVMTDDRYETLRALALKARLPDGSDDNFSFTRSQLLSRYKKDLPELLETMRREGAIPVLLSFGQKLQEGQSPDEQAKNARYGAMQMRYMSIDDFLRSADWYNETNKEIAGAHQVTYIEWHKRVPGEGGYFHDFRHFSSKGSALLAGILADEMQRSPIFSQAIAARFGCHSGTNKLPPESAW